MKKLFKYFIPGLCVLLALASCAPKDGVYDFQLFTTNDVHGRYFDSLYVKNATQGSLYSVSAYVDSVRTAAGAENVILIDAGDCMQGDNAAYYSNYVDTLSEHLYVRMVEYMDYDAVVVGNHDIETGHKVYDRVREQMDVPFLAANAPKNDGSGSYFQPYTILKRHGLKIAIIGFTNPNIKNWLSETLWSGMSFTSLIPFVQEEVDRICLAENPDAVIVAVHAGTGDGDGSSYESQGLDLFKSLKGVDFVICAHDHRPYIAQNDSICLINAGSHCRNLGHGKLSMTVRDGKVVAKSLSAELIELDKDRVDEDMREAFRSDFEKVKDFTLMEVGNLEMDLHTRDAYRGMSDYINLIHTLSLSVPEAQISFAAPLTFNGSVEAGKLIFNDLFTIYPFENQLFVVRMTGKEIKDYLEYSYDGWINTIRSSSDRLLKIQDRADARTGQKRWSFVGRSYNFDSAAGLIYEVDVTKPVGERVKISSLANGSEFCADSTYNVAMTSYRASGGGYLMREGAGIDTDKIDERIVARYPEIRNILYDYLKVKRNIESVEISAPSVIGHWAFVPERLAEPALDRDMALLF